jgi:outer membrane protein assembly factor BamB
MIAVVNLLKKDDMYRPIVFLISMTIIGQSVLSAQALKWYLDLNDMAFGMAAMADVDGDMLPEIAFSTYRNDERIIVLNAEDGSILWEYHTGGCNDVAPLISDVDLDGELEIVLPGSCNPKTFCFDARTGAVEWITNTHGSDSPPTVADLDNDGMPEILHGEFGGWILCLNGEDGSVNWNILVDGNSWIQTAPTILDIDLDGQLDFVVANWNFEDDHKIFAFRGSDHALLWESDEPEGVMYHGASHTDLDGDGYEELVIGDYSGKLMVFEAESGELAWSFRFPNSYSMAAPTAIADVDGDGELEIICIDWYQLACLNVDGDLEWEYDIPNFSSSFRGCAISDMDGDNGLDLVFATRDGNVCVVDGSEGSLISSFDCRSYFDLPNFEFNHGPIIGDFDNDDLQDVFVVGGEAQYPGEEENYGIALSISTMVKGGPDWPMFRRDVRRTACICDDEVKVDSPVASPEQAALFYNEGKKTWVLSSGFEGKHKFQIFDVMGRLVQAGDINKEQAAGLHLNGIYFYRIKKEGQLMGVGKVFVGG